MVRENFGPELSGHGVFLSPLLYRLSPELLVDSLKLYLYQYGEQLSSFEERPVFLFCDGSVFLDLKKRKEKKRKEIQKKERKKICFTWRSSSL